MIGSIVEYTISAKGDDKDLPNKTFTVEGEILDKVDMRENEKSLFSTTGYLVLNHKDKKVYPIAYWRIQKVIKN